MKFLVYQAAQTILRRRNQQNLTSSASLCKPTFAIILLIIAFTFDEFPWPHYPREMCYSTSPSYFLEQKQPLK